MNQFKELEYKYKARQISLFDFINFCEQLQYQQVKNVASWDYYYTKPDTEGFIRFRDSEAKPELTTKTKTTENNNFERIEIDLELNPSPINRQSVAYFLQSLGYKENFRIYKHCNIYTLEQVNFVYYVVMNHNLLPIDVFIEVEYNKSKLREDSNISDAKRILDYYDNKLRTLGLKPENRLSKSLFELFYKKD